MKTIVAVILTAILLAPAGYATGERITEARISKIERRLAENYRRDAIVQNVLYMKATGMYPQFLTMRMHVYECIVVRPDNTLRLGDFCGGVFPAENPVPR